MLVANLRDDHLINKKVGRQKISLSSSIRLTSGVGEVAQVFFWESLPNSNEKSNLTIEKYCSIASDVKFFLGGTHNYRRTSTYFNSSNFQEKNSIISNGDIHIKNDVYIGQGATVLSGVTIGNGAIVGAHALVSKDIPDYGIAVGNPAQVVKLRFSKPMVERLLDTQWWDLPHDILMNNSHLFFVEELSESILSQIESICKSFKTRV